jgi:hypothetical protein
MTRSRGDARIVPVLALTLAAGAAHAQCPAAWNLASAGVPTVPTDPSVRQNHAAVYDGARQTVLMFGGFLGGAGFRGDTWVWSAGAWSQVATTGPDARGNTAMAYDPVHSLVYLFGGAGAGGIAFGDTWQWDGRSWTLLSPPASPPARFNHAMAFDTTRGVTVMTGGFGTSRFSDTWEFDGTTWTPRTDVGTYGARSSHGMAFDEHRGRMVIFGGFNGARIADTWELTSTGWTSVSAPGPSGRQYLGMDYDPDHQVIVLFGGQIGPASADRVNDTWTYDGAAWTHLFPTTPPPARDQHTLTYDRADHNLVVFGGYQGATLGGTVGDTWASSCGPAACYANCDGSTSPPILNISDFICFQSAFAAGSSYANCDHSTSPPVLNITDFVCFQSAFAAGCP